MRWQYLNLAGCTRVQTIMWQFKQTVPKFSMLHYQLNFYDLGNEAKTIIELLQFSSIFFASLCITHSNNECKYFPNSLKITLHSWHPRIPNAFSASWFKERNPDPSPIISSTLSHTIRRRCAHSTSTHTKLKTPINLRRNSKPEPSIWITGSAGQSHRGNGTNSWRKWNVTHPPLSGNK
jgi:hypothetical protein